MTQVAFRECGSDELDSAVLAQILDLCHACWPGGAFSTDDLDHALGGRHFLAEVDMRVVSHVSVVPRTLDAADRAIRTGYVEAVATLPRLQRQGLASRLMAAANLHIDAAYELGALSTDQHLFYERLGWRRWVGQTWVRERDGTLTRTSEDDGGIMVLATRTTPRLTMAESLTCRWRPGDVW